MPSTNGVSKVYQQLRNILSVFAEQQAESSLQWWAKVSVSSVGHSKASRQRTTIEHPAAGTTSSSAWAPSCLRLGHPFRPLEPATCHQACGENDWACVEYRMCIQRRGGRSYREQRSLSPEGPGPKAFGNNVCDASFPKHFRAPNNIIKYDGKTNPSV
jgi:hypothetical protein